MILEDGKVYTPEQVSEAGWLGPLTAEAIRKAARSGEFEHTRIRRRILFTKANIQAIQADSIVPARPQRASSSNVRRARRAAHAPSPIPDGPRLIAKPEAARRRQRKAS